MRTRRLTIIVLFALITASMGCAHLIYPKQGSEETLRERVIQAWEARKNGDKYALYDLTSDQHKKRVARESFLYRTNVAIRGYSIEEVDIVEEGTKALVRVDMKINQMGFHFTFPIREEWLWQRGAWRLNLKSGPSEARKMVPEKKPN